MSRFASLIILVITALHTPDLCAQPAATDEMARARDLFQRGEQLYKAGDYARALVLYREAYGLKPLPGFLFNLGQCARQLGRCDHALAHFREFLSKLPQAPNRGLVEELIRECEAKLASQRPVTPAETSPDPRDTRPPTPENTASGPDTGTDAPEERSLTLTRSTRRRFHPVWFWSSVGLTGALLLTATVTGSLTLKASGEYRDATTRERQLELRDSGQVTGTITDVTLATGIAAAAAAVTLYFFTDWGRDEAAVSATPRPGGGAMTLSLPF